MGFHDRIALTSRLEGKTAALFRQAAQKHANAFWIWLIVAGVVWYFTNWAWASIPLALAAYVAIQSFSATMVASRMEKHEKEQS